MIEISAVKGASMAALPASSAAADYAVTSGLGHQTTGKQVCPCHPTSLAMPPWKARDLTYIGIISFPLGYATRAGQVTSNRSTHKLDL
jgi:hypothetical protein